MGRYDEASKRAAKQTDQELSEEMKKVTRLDENTLIKLFPTPADMGKLQELMEIVNASTGQNEKVAKFKEGAEKFADVAIKLIKTYIRPI